MTDTTAESSTIPQRSFSRRLIAGILRFAGFTLLWVVVIVTICWEILAVSYANLTGAAPRYFLATLVAVACLGAFYWYRRRQDPIALGKALNQSAWESSFEERGLPVPPSGPRDGYWGSRLGPKVSDPSVGWHEGRILVPGLLDIDARGFQHYVSAAERHGG